MKTVIVICLGVLASGCATPIPLSYEEQCATKSMKLQGVGTSSATATAYNYNSGLTTVSGYGESVNCAVPQDEQEAKKIEHTRYTMEPKLKYNSTVTGKKLVGGLGYVLYILPGVILKIVFDGQKQGAIEKSEELKRMPAGN